MKTIVHKEFNVSLYLFDDSKFVSVVDNQTIVGNPTEFIIADCNNSNVTLFENVTDPGDWKGWKYLYTEANGWQLNPNWNPPE